MPDLSSPRIESDLVVTLRAAGCVFAEDEARLLLAEAQSPADLNSMVRRRVAGFPLEQILGWAEFFGLRISVDPGVFVPRRRTELLVRQAVSLSRREAVVVELCCGSGAVSVALISLLDGIELYAADIDPAAARCAGRNLGSAGHVYAGDLFQPLPPQLQGRVDVLVVNAPYVPTGEIRLMPPEARVHEPRVALDGGPDGLDVHRRLAVEAPLWLAPDGALLVETSERQAPVTVDIFGRQGLVSRVVTSDKLDATVVIGTR